jgi:outer membrane protein assembly factor BamB
MFHSPRWDSFLSSAVLGCVLAVSAYSAEPSANWPQWRGPDHNGSSSTATELPVTWSATKNVVWKVALPSWSAATPIIWEETVFITSAQEGFNDPVQYQPGVRRRRNARPENAPPTKLYLHAVSRQDGSVMWSRETGDGNHIMRKQNMASPSPVTDGEHVWVMTGVGILTSFDFDGNQVWQRNFVKDYGAFGLNWGYASSPKLHDGRLYVQVIHGMKTDDPSYLMSIDAATGKNIWRVERPSDAIHESPDSYSTPILVPVDGKLQIVVSGADYVTGHNFDTGEELWRLGGFNPLNHRNYRTIASSIAIGDKVFTTSREGKPFVGFKAGGSGDLTGKSELWTNNFGTDVPTPTTDGEIIYVVNDRGIAVALDPRTGDLVWERSRLEPGTYSSSPLLADGRIYATSEDGATVVLKAGREFEILAVNKLDEYTLASPVAVGDQIFIRTMEHLYCIAKRN